jgi:FtsH-binding integral membrane protein
VAGVAAVLLPIRDVLGRVAWSAFVTALATGIVLPLSLLTTRKRTERVGLFCMVGVIAIYLLTVSFI